MVEIRQSRFVVANSTYCEFASKSEEKIEERPRGVILNEAGFALGLNTPVISTYHSRCIEHVQFAMRSLNPMNWNSRPKIFATRSVTVSKS